MARNLGDAFADRVVKAGRLESTSVILVEGISVEGVLEVLKSCKRNPMSKTIIKAKRLGTHSRRIAGW